MYCEIGKTSKQNLVSPDYQIDLPPRPKFRRELKSIFKHFPHLDSISFSGYYGEPTLNTHLSEFLTLARKVRDKREWEGDRPDLTLFTNSSTLYKKEIRNIVGKFDVILAKLDAATQGDFIRTVRPHKSVESINKIVSSIAKLRKEMPEKHKLVLQSLLYSSYRDDFPSNAHKKNVESLARAINEIKPNLVQIYSIARAPAEYFVYALDELGIKKITKKLKNLVNDDSIEIVGY